jgi:hypothetical protein
MTVFAVTEPSLFLVPVTPMKAPTLSAEALEVVPPLGPGLVLNVVLDEYTTATELLAFVSTAMSSPLNAVILPETVGLVMPPGGAP